MKLQFSITICLSLFTTGWYVVTKGKSVSAVLCFCDLRSDCLKSKVSSDKELSIYFFGYPRGSRHRLKFARYSSNVVFEEFILSSLIASPFIKPLFTSRRVARGKMGILKGFRRFVASFDVQDRFFYESLSLENHCIKESYFIL